MTGMWEKKAPLPYSWKSKVLQAFLKAIQQHLLELEMHLLFPLLGICSIEQKPSSLTLMYLMIRASTGKESACKAGDMGSISGLGRSPGEGNGNPLWNSCLGNAMDRGAWQATVPKSRTQLSV